MLPDNPWIWLAKEARDCPRDSDPAFTCPETSANRFSSTSMRRKSQFFPLKWNFSFTKRALWSEGKHQRWNKRPSYSLKRQVFFSFCSQHCCPRFAGFRVVFRVDTPFNWILLQSFIFKSHSIFFHLRKYMITRNNSANKNLAALSRVHVCPFRPKITMLLVIDDSYRFFS